jgi:isocitrate lyase
MKAYVELIQRKEREIGCDVLTHQKVSAGRLLSSHFGQRVDIRSGPVPITPIQC